MLFYSSTMVGKIAIFEGYPIKNQGSFIFYYYKKQKDGGCMREIEFSCVNKLKDAECKYFVIPESIILNKKLSERRIVVFSYFSIRRGLDQIIYYSTNEIINWLNLKPDNHSDGINNKIKQIIDTYYEEEYLLPFDSFQRANIKAAVLNLSKISDECSHNRFAVIYIDELQKIIQHKKAEAEDAPLTNNYTLLLVFAYLRMMICRRRNRLLPDEINCDNKNSGAHDISARRLRAPEAYDDYYCEIAERLGLSSRVVSNAVKALNELELIYFEALPRIRYCDGNIDRWRTDHTIFCNMYKREDKYLLASGEAYYLEEIKNKKKKLGGLKKKMIC